MFTTCHYSVALTAASKTARHFTVPEPRRTVGSGPVAVVPSLFGVSLSQHCPARRLDPTWGLGASPANYRPRDAEHTVLHQVIDEHLCRNKENLRLIVLTGRKLSGPAHRSSAMIAFPARPILNSEVLSRKHGHGFRYAVYATKTPARQARGLATQAFRAQELRKLRK
jgi:hypothetical protein